MYNRNYLLFLLFVLFGITGFTQQVPDSLKDNQKVKLYFESGSTKSGYLIYDNDTEIKIWSHEVGFLKTNKTNLARIEFLSSDVKIKSENEEISFQHAYALTNSALPPPKGEMYIRMPYYFNGVLDYGITKDLTLGLDVFYLAAMNANLRYRINFSENSNLAVAVGSYYTYFGGSFSGKSALFSSRLVYTVGDKDKNFSVGVNYFTNFNRIEIFNATVAICRKIYNRNYFIADLNIVPDLRSINGDLNYFGVGFLGLRIITKKDRCWDLGVSNILTESSYYSYNGNWIHDRFYLPLPYFQYSLKI